MCRKNFLCVARVESLENALARFAVIYPASKGRSSLPNVRPILGGLPVMPVQAAIRAAPAPRPCEQAPHGSGIPGSTSRRADARTFSSSAIARSVVAPLAAARSLA